MGRPGFPAGRPNPVERPHLARLSHGTFDNRKAPAVSLSRPGARVVVHRSSGPRRAAGPGRRNGPGYDSSVDLRAVKAASRTELCASAAAAADNAVGLFDDAELLSGAGRYARAYSLAVLAVEEFGKATSLVALAAMPENLRAQAPVRRMLEWHQLKQVGGLLIDAVGFRAPDAAARLAHMRVTQVEQILEQTGAFAEDADRLKRRGLYMDLDREGRIRRPSEITEAEVSRQLARARQVASSAGQLREPAVQARLAHPPVELIELSRALVGAFAEAGDVRSPAAAAAVVLQAVCKLKQQLAASDTASRS